MTNMKRKSMMMTLMTIKTSCKSHYISNNLLTVIVNSMVSGNGSKSQKNESEPDIIGENEWQRKLEDRLRTTGWIP